MPDINKEEIQKLESLRAELLLEYKASNVQDELNETEKEILLRQALLENYDCESYGSQLIRSYKFKDEESDSEETKVKTLTGGRHL